MDRVLHFVLALAVVAILALLVSSDRKKIRIRYVIQLLVRSEERRVGKECRYRSFTGVVLPELRRWFRLRERLLRNVRKTARICQRRD